MIRSQFHFKAQTIFVDKVPTWVGTACGEPYFDVPAYERLEEIAKHHDYIMKTVCFPLVDYDMSLT